MCLHSLCSVTGSSLHSFADIIFLDFLWPLKACKGVCALEEAVTSSRVNGLALVRKDLHLLVWEAGVLVTLDLVMQDAT